MPNKESIKPESKTSPKPGRPKKNRQAFDEAMETATADEKQILSIVRASTELRRKEPVNDVSIAARISWYMEDYTVESLTAPSYEGLALALGIDLETLGEWRDGKGDLSYDSKRLIKRTILTLANIDFALVSKGLMPQTVYQSRCRNYYGIREAATPTALPAQQPDAGKLLAEALKLPD